MSFRNFDPSYAYPEFFKNIVWMLMGGLVWKGIDRIWNNQKLIIDRLLPPCNTTILSFTHDEEVKTKQFTLTENGDLEVRTGWKNRIHLKISKLYYNKIRPKFGRMIEVTIAPDGNSVTLKRYSLKKN